MRVCQPNADARSSATDPAGADRQAVARAQRRTSKGIQQGYVDREGNWISVPLQPGVRMPGNADIRVVGWTPRHRPALATILALSPVAIGFAHGSIIAEELATVPGAAVRQADLLQNHDHHDQ